MRRIYPVCARLAASNVPIVIEGETGTGKEVLAESIHDASVRAAGPFVVFDCTTVVPNLAEATIFGHERGAFTGATATRRGAFEATERGTLFLDEIGELPLAAQAKLLRVLEDRRVTRVGATRSIAVEARVVAATNRDLETEVREKRFREDLYYRVNVHRIAVPPLRERRSDLPEIAQRLVAGICQRFGMRPKRIAADALDLLMGYDWSRNNVRELRNVVERMILETDGDVIGPGQIPDEIRGEAEPLADGGGSYQALRIEAERRIVLTALERNEWQITRTAADLGLADHASLLKIMRRLGIRRER